ncbi:MAG: carboxypeptidase regulatory-like domain-containing protein [Bryobacteraceae bacterium]
MARFIPRRGGVGALARSRFEVTVSASPLGSEERSVRRYGMHCGSRLKLAEVLRAFFRLSFVFAVCWLTSLNAQVASGTINVTVSDSTGAVVPGAAVRVTNNDTGLLRTGTTDQQGAVRFPFLPVGVYSVAVEATGFKQLTIGSVVLQVNQTAVVPISLEVGRITESIQVSAVTPLLESATSDLGQVIENQKIVDLPLNGRNPFALGLLAGNTRPVYGMGTNQQFVAGGGRFSQNDILLDGADNNTIVTDNSIGRSGVAITPSVDAVGEFKVKTNSFSAEFGRSAGAVVSATIKSGSNAFHGSLFEFLRNDKLDANNFISNLAGVEKGKFRQNQFGGSLGGP